jgi:prohibitin 2
MKYFLGIVGGIVAFFLITFAPFTTIGAGKIGVVTVFGNVQSEVLSPGFHWVSPFASIHNISVQTQTISFDNQSVGDNTEATSLGAASKDLQDVAIAVVVNYHIPSTGAKDIYQQFQGEDNFQRTQLEPIVRESVKAVSSQYTAEELVTKRIEFSDKVTTLLTSKFVGIPAVFDNFRVVNFEFSKDFTNAIEAKATAVQNAEASKNKLEQVKYEAQQQIETAKAEAETIRIKAQAITQQGGADYVKLQAIAKWNGVLPAQMIPGSAVPFIDINK